jgi:tetratricopeptide (TPR) repeat protein
MSWFDAEHANLVAAGRHAADSGERAAAWQLAAAVGGVFDMRGHRDELNALTDTSLACARGLDDVRAEHRLLLASAESLIHSRRFHEAEECVRRALELARVVDTPDADAETAASLAYVCNNAGDFAQAADHARQAVELYNRLGNTWFLAIATNQLGRALLGLCKPGDAESCHRQALEMFRALGDRDREAWALLFLGNAHRAQGRLGHAAEHHRLALDTARDAQNTIFEAEALQELGDDARLSGEPNAARQHWAQALTLYEHLGDPRADDMRTRLHT